MRAELFLLAESIQYGGGNGCTETWGQMEGVLVGTTVETHHESSLHMHVIFLARPFHRSNKCFRMHFDFDRW